MARRAPRKKETWPAIAVFVVAVLAATAALPQPGFREDFSTLDAWEPLTFPKIERHTRYSVADMDGRTVLKAEADASASGLVHTGFFNPYDTPVLRFRWRADNVFEKGNARRRDGDDYPIRVYVLFPYDPAEAGMVARAQYAIARRIFGRYPPHGGLNYIWANRKHERRILDSPYTGRSKMIVLQAGRDRLGQWIEEEVNILDDYRAAFGKDPPHTARLAVMSDSDDTGERATSYIDFIELAPVRDSGNAQP